MRNYHINSIIGRDNLQKPIKLKDKLLRNENILRNLSYKHNLLFQILTSREHISLIPFFSNEISLPKTSINNFEFNKSKERSEESNSFYNKEMKCILKIISQKQK